MVIYSCIIIEDEPIATEILEDYIKQVPFLQLKGICGDAIHAMEILQKKKIDVIFLDIHLPKVKGIDFIQSLKNPPIIIITSAYRDYALQCYEHNVLDYLLKPFSLNRFLQAVNKLQKPKKIIADPLPGLEKSRDHIFFNVGRKRVKIYLDEILFIESLKDYIRIVTSKKNIQTKFQIGQIEEILTNSNFLRVHRSFIVAKDKIDAFTAMDIEIGNKKIAIGQSYKKLVQSIIKNYKG